MFDKRHTFLRYRTSLCRFFDFQYTFVCKEGGDKALSLVLSENKQGQYSYNYSDASNTYTFRKRVVKASLTDSIYKLSK